MLNFLFKDLHGDYTNLLFLWIFFQTISTGDHFKCPNTWSSFLCISSHCQYLTKAFVCIYITISDQYIYVPLIFSKFFTMVAGGHFGYSSTRTTFVCIPRHFRLKCNFLTIHYQHTSGDSPF